MENEKNKEIHVLFSVSDIEKFNKSHVVIYTPYALNFAINRGDRIIYTTQICNLDYSVLDEGYDIYLHAFTGQTIKIDKNTKINGRKIKSGECLWKRILRHTFDTDEINITGIKY